MSNAPSSRFVYVTYIRTTPEKLWAALITPEFIKQYWLGVSADAEWKVGGSWRLTLPDGRMADTGQIVEFEPKRRLAIQWQHEMRPELKAEGVALCTMELEQLGEAVKLTVTHTIERENSKFIDAVSNGWPQILSNLKSLLENGAIVMTR